MRSAQQHSAQLTFTLYTPPMGARVLLMSSTSRGSLSPGKPVTASLMLLLLQVCGSPP